MEQAPNIFQLLLGAWFWITAFIGVAVGWFTFQAVFYSPIWLPLALVTRCLYLKQKKQEISQ
jgi:uncharacterized membrane protein YhiD involved in acid resistance